jgi:hypothetical protein
MINRNTIIKIFPYGLLLFSFLISKELVIVNQELFIILAFFSVFLKLKKIFTILLEDFTKEKQEIIRQKVVVKLQRSLDYKKMIFSNMIRWYKLVNGILVFLYEFPQLAEDLVQKAKKNYLIKYKSELIDNSQKLALTNRNITRKLAGRIFPVDFKIPKYKK